MEGPRGRCATTLPTASLLALVSKKSKGRSITRTAVRDDTATTLTAKQRARRLAEGAVVCVHGSAARSGRLSWDTHSDNFGVPKCTPAASTLVMRALEDLESRGMLDQARCSNAKRRQNRRSRHARGDHWDHCTRSWPGRHRGGQVGGVGTRSPRVSFVPRDLSGRPGGHHLRSGRPPRPPVDQRPPTATGKPALGRGAAAVVLVSGRRRARTTASLVTANRARADRSSAAGPAGP